MSDPKFNKVLFIVGPTATGKTSLALKLAKKFNAHIISADSRQVYQGLDIVTGKDIPKGFTWEKDHYTDGSTNIYGYDLVKPGGPWNVSLFQQYAKETIKKIISQKKLPIIVGGTGLYIISLLLNYIPPDAPPDTKFRDKLSKLTLTELQSRLKQSDPHHFYQLNHSDLNNPRRLIRALEIAFYSLKSSPTLTSPLYDSLVIGVTAPLTTIKDSIKKRVSQRLKSNPLKELEYLSSLNLPFSSPAYTSLGYQDLSSYQQGKIPKQELIDLWATHDYQYAKRQLTWFKKTPSVHWFDITSPYFSKVVDMLRAWYSHK